MTIVRSAGVGLLLLLGSAGAVRGQQAGRGQVFESWTPTDHAPSGPLRIHAERLVPDSVRHRRTYAGVGAIVGGVLGAALLSYAAYHVYYRSAPDARSLVPVTIGGGILGAGLGALVGYSIGREYERPSSAPDP